MKKRKADRAPAKKPEGDGAGDLAYYLQFSQDELYFHHGESFDLFARVRRGEEAAAAKAVGFTVCPLVTGQLQAQGVRTLRDLAKMVELARNYGDGVVRIEGLGMGPLIVRGEREEN